MKINLWIFLLFIILLLLLLMFWCINFFENARNAKMLKEQRECESIPFSFFFSILERN